MSSPYYVVPTDPDAAAYDADVLRGRQIAREVATRIAPIPERPMRTASMGEQLAPHPPEILVEVFRAILQWMGAREEVLTRAYDSLTDFPVILDRIGNATMSEVYTLARRKSYGDVVILLQAHAPSRVANDADRPREDPKIKELTLGERKSLARTHDQDTINRLLHDQNPHVIRMLLRNPHLTVRHVVTISAKRPTSEKVLEEVARSPRWNVHYHVRRALLLNPYTPPQTATRFVSHMLRQDLVEICRTGNIHANVRSAALTALRARGGESILYNDLTDGNEPE